MAAMRRATPPATARQATRGRRYATASREMGAHDAAHDAALDPAQANVAPALAGIGGVTLAWRAWVAQFPPEARLLLDLLIEVNCRIAREKVAQLAA